MYSIETITIEKLHGEFTYELHFTDNRVIIVAENGAGKTTVVNIIYYLLSRQWNKLSHYNFLSVTVRFESHEEVKIDKEELSDFVKFRRLRSGNLKRNLPYRYRDIYDDILLHYDINTLAENPRMVEKVADKFNLPIHLFYDMVTDIQKSSDANNLFQEQFRQKELTLKRIIDAQILYLPTYRRIEQDLKTIFPHLEENIDSFRKKMNYKEEKNNVYVELVEFGMEDVEQNLAAVTRDLYNNFNNNLLSSITGSYLKDVINRKYLTYESAPVDFDVKVLDIVLARINADVLEDAEKEKLRAFVSEIAQKENLSNEDRMIAHFIYRLIEIYADQRLKEKDIEDFVEICNTYIKNKAFYYDPNKYELLITLKRNKKPIQLKDLSSGEKQIVSLFSHLFLSKEKRFFIIIDEPELSLSVPWQKRLLQDIITAKYCAGLLAATHSPFIFENELDPSTHGLEEFLKL